MTIAINYVQMLRKVRLYNDNGPTKDCELQ